MVVLAPRGPRTQIAIPAQGLIEFKDHLTDMLERYHTQTEESNQPELPESKSLRADNKTFYFDCGSNQRGVFLKISEVRQNRYRTLITVPEKYWTQFRDQINEFVEKSTTTTTTTTGSDSELKSAEVKTETEVSK